MRLKISILAALALVPCIPGILPWGGSASAQVAVPMMNPVAPNVLGAGRAIAAGFVTINPAAMQWGAPSRIGFGYAQGSLEPDAGDKTDFHGQYVGGRLVGQRFSAAAEGIATRDDDGPRDFAVNARAAALGIRLLNSLVVGAGYSSIENREGLVQRDVVNISAGASYRVGEWLFAGGSFGRDSLKLKDESSIGQTLEISDEREVITYGAGVRFGGGLRAHLEYYGVHGNAFEQDGTKYGVTDTRAAVAELGLGPFVLGARWITLDEDQAGPNYKTTAQLYDIAWSPVLGLAIGLHHERTEEELDLSNAKTNSELTAVTIAYQF